MEWNEILQKESGSIDLEKKKKVHRMLDCPSFRFQECMTKYELGEKEIIRQMN